MAEAVALTAKSRNPLRRLYGWVLGWAHHPAGTWALAIFAFLDSSVFPIPPLFLQVALSLERPKRSFWYATIDWLASVAGAILGYYIGYALWESIGVHIIGTAGRDRVAVEFEKSAFAFILVYSFLPFPFKFITIGSGFFHDRVHLVTLLVASSVGRATRFYLLAALCYWFGPPVKGFIDRYFNWVLLGIGALVAAVLLVMKLYAAS